MTEINNNKKRKIDDSNQSKKDDSNYHPFVRSNKKKEVLSVSPNNYLSNIKQIKQYAKEEKKENIISNESSANSKQEVQIQNEIKEHETFISPLLLNKKSIIIETEYELRNEVKELKHKLEEQKLEYELKLSELNSKYLEEHMNLEHSIDTLRIENITLKKSKEETDLEKQNLETTRRLIYEKELKSKEKIQQLKDELQSLRNETNLELHQTNNESILLKDALFNSQKDFQHYKSDTELNINVIKNKFHNYEEKIKLLKTELDKRTNKLNETMSQLKEVENNYKDTQLENKKLRQNATEQEMAIIKKELQNQLKYIRDIEKKNKDLKKQNEYYKGRNENVEILKEEIKTLENKAKSMNLLHEKIYQLEIENSKLQDEHIKWASFLEEKDTVGFNTPQDIAKTLAEQRVECALLKQKEGEFNVKVASLQEYINELENKVNELNSKYQKEYANNQNNLKIISYREKSKDLIQRRIDMLEEQLKSYDLEEMTMKNHEESVKIELEKRNKRISELEDLLNVYQNRIYELEKEASSNMSLDAEKQETQDETISNYSKRLTLQLIESDKEIHCLKKENTMLQKENDTLNKLVEKLEFSLGRGEYNPETTRVVQLAKNPELEEYSIRKNTLEALKNENKALLEIIKKNNLKDNISVEEMMEDNTSNEEHIENIPIETYKRLEIENNRIKELEKQLDRLKTVFRKKSKEYREVVYSLLGYRFDFLQDGRVKLTSMYSQHGNHSFVFSSSSNDSGSMELTGGGKSYIQSLEKRIDYFVGQYGSIPGLLASVTLDLFNQLKEQNKLEPIDNN